MTSPSPSERVAAAEDLSELCEILNAMDVDDIDEIDTADFPTFGGVEPSDTWGIYSWDENEYLVPGSGGEDHWTTIAREDFVAR